MRATDNVLLRQYPLMTDVTTYPLIDDFDTTLAQAWDGATGTIYLNEAIGVTIPSGVTTLVVVSP